MGSSISCTGTCRSDDVNEIAGDKGVQPIAKDVDGVSDNKVLRATSFNTSKRRLSSRQSKVHPQTLPAGPATAWSSSSSTDDGVTATATQSGVNNNNCKAGGGGSQQQAAAAAAADTKDDSVQSSPAASVQKLSSDGSKDVSSTATASLTQFSHAGSNDAVEAVLNLGVASAVGQREASVLRQKLQHDTQQQQTKKPDGDGGDAAQQDAAGVDMGGGEAAEAADDGIVSSLVLASAEFMKACKGGDIAVARKLLAQGSGVDVNDRDEEGMTPLHLASSGGHLEVVQALLAAPDIDVNARDKEDATAIGHAVMGGHVDVLRALLATQRVDANALYGTHVSTLLHLATMVGELEVVRALLATPGVNVNAQNRDGFSALALACYSGHLEIARALLAAPGVDVNLTEKGGHTALYCASEKGYLEVVETLLVTPGIDLTTPNKRGWTALHSAGHHGREEVVKVLLAAAEEGFVNKQGNEDGWTALHATVHTGKVGALRALLSAPGLDVNLRDKNGRTALDDASEGGCVEMVHLILATPGVQAGAAGENGRTALHRAATKQRSDIMEVLARAPGVDVNARDEDGNTALHITSEVGLLKGVQLLLMVPGLDVNSRDEDGRTALHISSRKDHMDVVTALLSALSLDVNIQDKDGRSALHYASWRGSLRIVRALLEAPGIDATLRDVDGFAAAHLAAIYGRSEVTQQLVRAAATSLPSTQSIAASALEFMQDEVATRAKDIAKKGMELQVPTSKPIGDLPPCVANLHYDIPQDLQRKPARLIKVSKLLLWDTLLVYEDVPKSDVLAAPYSNIGDSLWYRTVALSWRWGRPKPAVRQPGFSPMSEYQFSELKSMLKNCQESAGVEYVWIDWCSVPQYPDSTQETMTEVLRSKAYYVRARQMLILPTFNHLPKSGTLVVAGVLKAMKAISEEADCKPGDPLILEALSALTKDGAMVASHDYFRRIWTLAERMTRYGHDERLCHYLSLEIWLGMVVEALLSNSQDNSTLDIFDFDPEALNTVRGMLQSYTDKGSLSASQLDMLAGAFKTTLQHAVYAWWGHKAALEDTPTTEWLQQYLRNACSEAYQATCTPDRAWAIFSYYSGTNGNGGDTAQPSSFLGALRALFMVATGTESKRLPLEGPNSLPYPPDDEVQILLAKVTLEIRQKSGDQPDDILLDAAKSGLSELVKLLLEEEGVDVNYYRSDDEDGETALQIASRWGQAEVVRLLLRYPGVDVNAKSQSGRTALTLACFAGHIKVVRALLEAPGVDVNSTSSDAVTPLHAASLVGHVEVVRALLAAPAIDIRARRDGQMPIHWASEMGQTDVVRALLEAGVDVNVTDVNSDESSRYAYTPLHFACKAGALDVVQLLLAIPGVNVNANTGGSAQDGVTPLWSAVKKGRLEVVQTLLARPDVGVSVQNVLDSALVEPDYKSKRDLTAIIALLRQYKH